MPACLGNTATPHVPLLKKCHTSRYTAPRAWPGQRSGEASPARAEAGKTNSCASRWMQEAKTLNCQPCSPEPPQHWHGEFSLHILLEALRSLRDNLWNTLFYLLAKMGRFPLICEEDFLPTHHPYSGLNSAACRASVLLLRCCPALQPRSLEARSPFFVGHKSLFHDNYFICPIITQSICKSTSVPNPTISIKNSMT